MFSILFRMSDSIAFNPFAYLTEPAAVHEALQRNERLNRLASRIHRPMERKAPRPDHASARLGNHPLAGLRYQGGRPR